MQSFGVLVSFCLLLDCFSWWKMTELCYSNYSLMNQLVMHFFNTWHGHSWPLELLFLSLGSAAAVELCETVDGCSLWLVLITVAFNQIH